MADAVVSMAATRSDVSVAVIDSERRHDAGKEPYREK